MSLTNFAKKLNHLKQSGVNIGSVLDIGAYKGEFSKLIRSIYPYSHLYMFEPNNDHIQDLTPLTVTPNCYLFNRLLSDTVKEVDFFSIKEENGLVSTGSSIYRELTSFYDSPIITKKTTSTLDSVSLNLKDDILIKLDVQGSEIDILKGGVSFISKHNPRYYILELSIKPYNLNAPLAGEVFTYMNNFTNIVDILDTNYQNGELLQIDVLFERK